mmetsp:Transcript_24535/g.66672  ORF Transcript_24535/g.66672 Transcript_24535/m.66672 type:complete len:321 (-) Transcript_24535:1733-2695(-)
MCTRCCPSCSSTWRGATWWPPAYTAPRARAGSASASPRTALRRAWASCVAWGACRCTATPSRAACCLPGICTSTWKARHLQQETAVSRRAHVPASAWMPCTWMVSAPCPWTRWPLPCANHPTSRACASPALRQSRRRRRRPTHRRRYRHPSLSPREVRSASTSPLRVAGGPPWRHTTRSCATALPSPLAGLARARWSARSRTSTSARALPQWRCSLRRASTRGQRWWRSPTAAPRRPLGATGLSVSCRPSPPCLACALRRPSPSGLSLRATTNLTTANVNPLSGQRMEGPPRQLPPLLRVPPPLLRPRATRPRGRSRSYP